MTLARKTLHVVLAPRPRLGFTWYLRVLVQNQPPPPGDWRVSLGTSARWNEEVQCAPERGGGAPPSHPIAAEAGFIFLARGGWEDLNRIFSCCSLADLQCPLP